MGNKGLVSALIQGNIEKWQRREKVNEKGVEAQLFARRYRPIRLLSSQNAASKRDLLLAFLTVVLNAALREINQRPLELQARSARRLILKPP
jgi:hypothetical protein